MYMVISKIPEKKIEKEVEVDLEALINKGARVKQDTEFELAEYKRILEEQAAEEKRKAEEIKLRDGQKWHHINLRISHEMNNEIKESLKNKVGLTRNGLILQAIRKYLSED